MFTHDQPVLFRHCDPAGIVFFPRYYEMVNDCVEAFFDRALGWPFHEIHAGGAAAVPTAEIRTRFTAPSRHGDHLILSLQVTRAGVRSTGLEITGRCDGETRFTHSSVLVHVGPDGRPRPWPDRVAAQLNELAKGSA